jgi:hypothetical protein
VFEVSLVENNNRGIDVTRHFDMLCEMSDFFSAAALTLLLLHKVVTIYIPFDFIDTMIDVFPICLESLCGHDLRFELSARSVAAVFMTASFYDIPSMRDALMLALAEMTNTEFFGLLDELMGAGEYVRSDARRIYGDAVIDAGLARIRDWTRELVGPQLLWRCDQYAEDEQFSYLAYLVTTHVPRDLLYSFCGRDSPGGLASVFSNAIGQALAGIDLHDDNHVESFDDRHRLHLAICELLDVNPNIWGGEEEEDAGEGAEEDDDEPADDDEVLTPQSVADQARARAGLAAAEYMRGLWADAGVPVTPRNSHKKNGTGSATRASQSNVAKARAVRQANVERQRAVGGTKQQAATLFCFIMLITGTGYAAVEMMCAFLGVPTPSSSTLYSVQHRVIARIVEMAVLTTAMASQMVAPGAVLSFDGSWNHPRWGTQCLGCFIDLALRKVVDFRIVKKKGKTTSDPDAVDASSQALEGIAFERLAGPWKTRGQKIRGLAHDRNGQVTKIVRDLGWAVVERFDRNHVVLSMCRAFKKFAKVLPEGKKRRVTVLDKGMQAAAASWFHVCLKDPRPLPVRKDMWTSAVDHWKGDRSEWKGKTSEVTVQQITSFLLATVHLLDSVEAGFSTQISESLNARWVHLASKLIAWGPSWLARVAVAILNFNEGHSWKLWAYDILREEFRWPELTQRSRMFLEKTFAKSASEQERRATAEYQRAANAARWSRKSSNCKAKTSDAKKGRPTHNSGLDGSDDELDGDGTEGIPQISPGALELALQEWPEVAEPVAPICIDADGVYPICCFVNPGCWCHLCALISALLSIGCVSDAIMAVDDPLPLVLTLQHVIIASAQSPDHPVLLGEVASAMARLIVDPPLIPFFQADQDPMDDLLLVLDGLLAQDGVNIRELLWAAVGSPDEESGPDGALAPQEFGAERDMPFFRVASTAARGAGHPRAGALRRTTHHQAATRADAGSRPRRWSWGGCRSAGRHRRYARRRE